MIENPEAITEQSRIRTRLFRFHPSLLSLLTASASLFLYRCLPVLPFPPVLGLFFSLTVNILHSDSRSHLGTPHRVLLLSLLVFIFGLILYSLRELSCALFFQCTYVINFLLPIIFTTVYIDPDRFRNSRSITFAKQCSYLIEITIWFVTIISTVLIVWLCTDVVCPQINNIYTELFNNNQTHPVIILSTTTNNGCDNHDCKKLYWIYISYVWMFCVFVKYYTTTKEDEEEEEHIKYNPVPVNAPIPPSPIQIENSVVNNNLNPDRTNSLLGNDVDQQSLTHRQSYHEPNDSAINLELSISKIHSAVEDVVISESDTDRAESKSPRSIKKHDHHS